MQVWSQRPRVFGSSAVGVYQRQDEEGARVGGGGSRQGKGKAELIAVAEPDALGTIVDAEENGGHGGDAVQGRG